MSDYVKKSLYSVEYERRIIDTRQQISMVQLEPTISFVKFWNFAKF